MIEKIKDDYRLNTLEEWTMEKVEPSAVDITRRQVLKTIAAGAMAATFCCRFSNNIASAAEGVVRGDR